MGAIKEACLQEELDVGRRGRVGTGGARLGLLQEVGQMGPGMRGGLTKTTPHLG